LSDFWIKTAESAQHQGPFSGRQIKQLATTGQLKPDHLVSSDDCATWNPARQFGNLDFGALVLETEESPEVSPLPGRPRRPRPAATNRSATSSHGRREIDEHRAPKKSRRALIATTCCVVGIAVLGIAIVGFSGTGPGSSGLNPGGDGTAIDPDTPGPSTSTSHAGLPEFLKERLRRNRLEEAKAKGGTSKSSEELPNDDELFEIPEATTANTTQEITFKELNLLGERYEGQGVKMSGCKFDRVSSQWLSVMPTVRVLTHDRPTTIDTKDERKWFQLHLYDRDSKSASQSIYALKDHWLDTFINMSPGQVLSIAGGVVENEHGGYSIVLTDVDTGDAAKEVTTAKQTVVLIPDAAKATGSGAVPFAIKKDEFLASLRKHLLARQEEEVVRLLGKPVKVENRSFYYDCHVRDELTGAVYRHIRVRLSMSGLCILVSLGQSRLVR